MQAIQPKLSPEEKELFTYIDGLIPEDGHLTYNLADPKQYAFAKLMAELGGETDRYPGRVKTLEMIRDTHVKTGQVVPSVAGTPGNWQNLFTIPSLGLDPTGADIVSNGFATILGGYSNMNLTMIIQDNTTHDIVAAGANNDFSGTFLPVATTPNTSGDTNVSSFMHYSYTANEGTAEGQRLGMSAGVVKRAFQDGASTDPSITAPVRTTTAPLNPKAINIGLGREWTDQGGSSQFDYAWAEPNKDHPVGQIPFVGSITFNSAIQAPLNPGISLYLVIYVADKTGGGGVKLSPSDLKNVYNAFSIDTTNPNKLKWNLPPGQSTKDAGNPIVFTSVTWNSDMLSYFYCGMTVVMADGSLQFAAVQSQDSPDVNPTDGIKEIMPIEFIWHCLGEGTQITMADGSMRPIETLLAGEQVMTADGPAPIFWVNKGRHHGSVTRIEAENSQTLLSSGNHVVMTMQDGKAVAKLAKDLQVGDMLGDIRITKVEHTAKYEGMLYNLATQDYHAPETPPAQMATFIANGFVVGDMNAQRAMAYRNKNDINFVKRNVPAYLHPDVDAFFEKQQQRVLASV